MNIKPCRDWIYFEARIVTKIAGLEIPDMAQKKEEYVTVLKIGSNVKKISIGERLVITFRDVINHKTENDTTDLIHGFVREEDVIAKIE